MLSLKYGIDKIVEVINENSLAVVDSFYDPEIVSLDNNTFEGVMSKSLTAINESMFDYKLNRIQGVEIITEATINHAMDKIDINTLFLINENVFGVIYNKIGTVLKSMVTFIKNIIEKIKTDAKLMTKDNDKFLDVIGPKLADKKSGDASKFVYTDYNWRDTKISKGQFDLKNMSSVNDSLSDLKDILDTLGKFDESSGYTQDMNKFVHQIRSSLKNSAGLSKLKDDNLNRAVDDSLESIFGETNVDKYLDKITQELRGDAVKIQITGFSKISPDEMKDVVKSLKKYLEDATNKYDKAKETLDKGVKTYVDHKDKLQKFTKDTLKDYKPDKLKVFDDGKEVDELKFKDEMIDARDEIIKIVDYVLDLSKTTLNWIGKETTLRKNLAEDQVTGYKRVLAAYVKAKSSK